MAVSRCLNVQVNFFQVKSSEAELEIQQESFLNFDQGKVLWFLALRMSEIRHYLVLASISRSLKKTKCLIRCVQFWFNPLPLHQVYLTWNH